MKFGPVPVGEAEGAILAHSERVAAGRIPKGTWLTAAHIADLMEAGATEVVVARLAPGDVHEDAAAMQIAEALRGPGLLADGAATGRVNLRARAAGIVEVDVPAIETVNRVNPAITVATVAAWARLGARGLAVTVKIIPFAVAQEDVAEACARAHAAVRLREPSVTSATLIESVGGAARSDKGRDAVQVRLDRFGVALSERVVVPHEVADIAAALRAASGEVLLILTGSATSDIADTAPAAVRVAGGQVLHYGMPVDPGNLLFIGRLGSKVVIGLPGCARSPALNGADWVLERMICGVAPEDIDIPAMGVGGLLKEIPSRPRPREG
ncbi:molybdopterin-binding protein [Rhodobacteraceae bacterium N5(2021)]|uniref:Molybdopterin-binding protein n=1 Tax=Gymnodinialimonas phycosphaerae TaxID=2841589 RepID=A0A975TW78_9RHOB|nr:molybdopterin-binding protein [Gymnodinialimonas phycosphaerae]MBY4891558.1 molybdopterin-binding protein [Gymnodinialimonas phycosphaerae]